MTHSASSASSLDSHAPSETSQSQGVRWEEHQKVLALEQLCGVFRVDLGHMRSLRLFFRSDTPPARLDPALSSAPAPAPPDGGVETIAMLKYKTSNFCSIWKDT